MCALRYACLDYDKHTGEDGARRSSPVLVHDMPKVQKTNCLLPIHEREAEIIIAQQARPFPRVRVIPYAFRHSFAQRHADAGTPVDTLKELRGPNAGIRSSGWKQALQAFTIYFDGRIPTP